MLMQPAPVKNGEVSMQSRDNMIGRKGISKIRKQRSKGCAASCGNISTAVTVDTDSNHHQPESPHLVQVFLHPH